MNDRSQGGSVIKDGRIELMQNRRLFKDDDRGVDEALNETDEYGNGISVTARYRVIFTERALEISTQR
jgi:Glycosyl hydrolases family 38 C-terminal domain